jgi:DNA gyrase subunit A
MDKLQEEFNQIQKDIARYELILSDRDELNGVIKEEILTIRNRYSDKRRTEISPVEGEIDIEALIPVDEMVVTMTHFGYVKRLSESTYRAQNRGGRGVSALTTRAEDYVEQMYVVNSHSDMLFFTDHGRAFGMKCYEIPEAGRQARGTAIVNLLQLQGGEKVNMMLPVPDRHGDDYLVMATRNGIIKKTALSEFINMRKTGLIAINLIEDDSLIGVALTDGKSDIMLATSEGKVIRFHEKDVRSTGRATQGVRSMRLTEGDYIVSMGVVEEDKQVLTVSEDGYGKRTLPEEFNAQRRGGQGVIAMRLSEKTGKLAAMLFVDEEDEVMMITDEGIMIRTPVSDIRICGRATQGVRMMRVDEGGRIVDVDTIAKEDDDELEHDEHHRESSHLSDEEYQSFDDMDEEASEDLEEDLE